MKTYIVIAFVLSSIALSSNELSWVDTQVEAIKPARKGMSDDELNKIKDPFIFYKNRSKKNYVKSIKKPVKYASVKKYTTSSDTRSVILQQPSKRLVLSAIINNSALINGEWYKVNESVDSFKLSSVNRTSVVLTKGNGKLVLTTSDTKRNLKFK
ncbi:hypothetical protein [Sulfurimonas sp.]|uniref:hypothetical protein n=1 Tax=Sulfurimonas sp. TaxID=2022749 RepID=UPI003568B8A8